jgi:3-hydroxyacyl-[acyl-carrier-protein] dehydratase
MQSGQLFPHPPDCQATAHRLPPRSPLQPRFATDTTHGAVKFNLIDKIEFASRQKLIGIKQVSLAEEYLADHFPTFPVLPGVLMLEVLTQAASWVLHLKSDFACSMAVLKEARNVKYGAFVAPGSSLRVEVDLSSQSAGVAQFKAVGMVGSAQAISARLELAYFNLADRQSELADLDTRLIEHHRARWALLAPQKNAETISC